MLHNKAANEEHARLLINHAVEIHYQKLKHYNQMQRQTTVSSENKLVMAEYKLSQLENKIKQVSLGVK